MTHVQPMRWGIMGIAAAAVIGLGVGQAGAASTSIAPPSGGEHSHEQIFEHVYGGDFIASGLDFGNGTVTATRIDDDLDQVWSLDTIVNGSARAVFAKFDQSFGYLPGDSGPTGDYTELFDVTVGGNGYSVTGSEDGIDLVGDDFRWARQGGNGVASSLDSDNIDELDHLITYQISGLGDVPQPVYMLFFEDLYSNDPSDLDYNDLVVEIAAVPTPAAIGPGLALLGLAGFTRRRRRRA